MHSEEREKNILDEFPALHDTCYLDHAGTTLYAKRQLSAVYKELNETVFGNPHSLSLSSRRTSDSIDQVRFRILKHFHTNPNEYTVVFTSSATAALKLVAENFIWKRDEDDNGDSGHVHSNVFEGHTMHSNFETQKLQESEHTSDYFSSILKESCYCKVKTCVVQRQGKSKTGSLVYLQDNHTSVLGMRELAAEGGACVHCMTLDDAFSVFKGKEEVCQEKEVIPLQNSLFVFPAQSNFSGVKYPLSWIRRIQSGILNCKKSCSCHNSRWFCFLDAASYVSTSDLDLSAVQPDFLCVSFYKIFGYPTGIGALLVRNSSGCALKKTYFGGGTVQISLSSERFHVPRPSLSERFEDGTIPFLSIVALRHGFDVLQSLSGSMRSVSLHTQLLAKYVHHSLLLMHHHNGSPAAVLYSDTDYEDSSTQGSIVNFNLLRSNGEFIGFGEVLNFANLYGIHLRTGCFCNPGACQQHLNISIEDLKTHFQAGHVCGDEMDLIDGKPTGSVRISFGYMSMKHDADKILDMITSCFIDGPLVKYVPQWWPSFQRNYQEKFGMINMKNGFYPLDTNMSPFRNENASVNEIETDLSISAESKYIQLQDLKTKPLNHAKTLDEALLEPVDHLYVTSNRGVPIRSLTHIFLYPVKSCGPMSVQSWVVNSRGLLYDREWMIVESAGVALTQKRETKLCLIQPTIDIEKQCLVLEYQGLSPITVPLKQDSSLENEVSLCESKVCGDYIKGVDCGDGVADWLCTALGREGLRLLRQGTTSTRTTKFKSKTQKPDSIPLSKLSLANQAQFLLVNTNSIQSLADQIPDKNLTIENLLKRFRCNFAVNAFKAFDENKWCMVQIGNTEFQVEGPCTRCQMVCIDQQTGKRTKEPLKALAQALHGKMKFGIYLRHQGNMRTLRVGDSVASS